MPLSHSKTCTKVESEKSSFWEILRVEISVRFIEIPGSNNDPACIDDLDGTPILYQLNSYFEFSGMSPSTNPIEMRISAENLVVDDVDDLRIYRKWKCSLGNHLPGLDPTLLWARRQLGIWSNQWKSIYCWKFSGAFGFACNLAGNVSAKWNRKIESHLVHCQRIWKTKGFLSIALWITLIILKSSERFIQRRKRSNSGIQFSIILKNQTETKPIFKLNREILMGKNLSAKYSSLREIPAIQPIQKPRLA
jgi:hypothetical protein